MPTSDSVSERKRPKRQVSLGPTGEHVRRNVQRARKGRGLTHAQVVERMAENGVSMPRTALSEIENGGRRVDVDDLTALSAALDVPVLALLFDVEDLNALSSLGTQADGLLRAQGIPADDTSGVVLQALRDLDGYERGLVEAVERQAAVVADARTLPEDEFRDQHDGREPGAEVKAAGESIRHYARGGQRVRVHVFGSLGLEPPRLTPERRAAYDAAGFLPLLDEEDRRPARGDD